MWRLFGTEGNIQEKGVGGYGGGALARVFSSVGFALERGINALILRHEAGETPALRSDKQ
jgi:hypothetical protein